MELNQIEKFLWEIPQEGEMVVPARVYANEQMVKELKAELDSGWSSLEQLQNLTYLKGVQKYALALADIHPGYGSPIGGVIAVDPEDGWITFGSVGFDINCGVRVLKTNLEKKDLIKKQEQIANQLFRDVPAGLGRGGEIKLNEKEVNELLLNGSEFALEKGYGNENDLKFTEMNGKSDLANVDAVSKKAKQRMFKQLGTVGSGNHYLEVQFVEKIFDEEKAKDFGLFENQVLISIHCGSRGCGHQIGTDYLQVLSDATRKYGIKVKDKELVSAPFHSEEGQNYFGAVNAGINVAFANRHVLAHLARKSFEKVFNLNEDEMPLLYDVGHNTAKMERHKINGSTKEVLVLRKGSTRGFGPGHKEIPKEFQKAGQPIAVGGSMGTASYILAGTKKGMNETFGSAVHGAGRLLSRAQAKKQFEGKKIIQDLKQKGILIKAHSFKGAAEEAPLAYKNIENVIDVMHESGVNLKVARVMPLANVKG